MQNVYTVAQVNSYINNMFRQDFMLQSIYVKGEVSNCKYHSSGHIYFTIKDAKGTIACVMFAGNRAGLRFKLMEGQQIIVLGSIEVYERDGKYQMYAKEIVLDGAGALYEQYERLKQELEERGLFAKEYKQPIPKYVQTLGVVTAPTGAAVQDIMNIAKRRNPYIQIILYPAIVQGEQAPASIVNGIHALEKLNVDLIIVGRGGGSIEDLWAFNEEYVAQAIFDCSIPIISAVGHETDTTIADYVADLRAPTPSAAAELAVCDIHILQETLNGYVREYDRLMKKTIEARRNILLQKQMKLQYLSPMNQLKEKKMYVMQLENRLHDSFQRVIDKRRHMLELYLERFKGLSPLDKLNQGFSYVADEEGRTIADVEKVKPGTHLTVHVRNGKIEAEVLETEKIRREIP
ncbi:MAG: exodeoxyribonuclease VII large subunit [Lachnospiraceae bacterium]|nr:exodeoxyribonuclease VII large subunit [Lachnospiraceae bacterium]